jgi:Cys-tRNA(Pro) deacylase
MGVRFMRDHGIEFIPHVYRYQGGGAQASAELLGIEPLRVAKTIILEDDTAAPVCVVMNGPFEVATGLLARELGRKRIEPCTEKRAEALTGYRVGGISPFGQRTEIPLYVQLDLFEYERIVVNGGQRGFLVEIEPRELERTRGAHLVDVATKR